MSFYDIFRPKDNAHVLRAALRLYEYAVMRSKNGFSFKAVAPNGDEEPIELFGD